MPRGPFPGVFIRAPIVEKILPNVEGVQKDEQEIDETVVAPARQVQDAQARNSMAREVRILGTLPGRMSKSGAGGATIGAAGDIGDIIAVQQGNVFGTSFHPELTTDIRIHLWWLLQLLKGKAPTLQSI